MTSIVGKKIGAVGSGHLELFPFDVLAICKCQNIETMLSLMAMLGVLVSICSLHGLVLNAFVFFGIWFILIGVYLM